ncbi:biotin-dependent carboxyltransferase family protein [Arthrobacter sp. NPDC089319]|uniref:5-oxoprolinase subunit C family protein n=1 Tax=Arthrobacter sp. NPDC089319 TaxID=3155915 RepID=UPI00343891E8
MLTVLKTGPELLVQDLGRPGNASVGLGPSGALDVRALRAANRLVGNPESAAGLELLLGGAALQFNDDAVVALTGAFGEVSAAGSGSMDRYRPFRITAGQRLEIGVATSGLRYYLAVAGGIVAEQLMGSAATDLLSGMGPARLQDGDVLRVGAGTPAPESPWMPVPLPPAGTVAVRLQPGPRLDWFAADTRQRLALGDWSVSADSNRVGLRLLGRPLQRVVECELPSEGMVTGAVQVPPSGLPTVFLADHPVTGGYPVPAVVAPADLPLLAQARPGQRIRFHWAG